MKISFLRIWREKPYDLKRWTYYNVFIALCPIWASWLVLMVGGVFSQFLTPLTDGTLLMFAVTLSGASMSFFETATQSKLDKTQKNLYKWLLAVIIAGAIVYAAIVGIKQFSKAPINQTGVMFLTSVLALLALYFNLYLAGLKSVLTDDNLMSKLIEEEAEDLAKAKKRLSTKAQNANSVDGADL